MRILALHTMGHDTGLAFFNNGQLEFAIETERLTREKHDHRVEVAIKYYLEEGPENPKNLDLIVFSTNIRNSVAKIKDLHIAMKAIANGKLHYVSESNLFDKPIPCLIVAHEASHAALACHYANWHDPCLILVNEGQGTFSRNALFSYEKQKLVLHDRDILPWYGTGFGWSAIGYALGFGKSPSTAGRVMAIGAFGSREDKVLTALREVSPDIHYKPHEQQTQELQFLTKKTDFLSTWGKTANLVYALQSLFIEEVSSLLKTWQKKLSIFQIALGGGCALNLPLNTYVRDNICSTVAIPPACNDSGQALGAGVYALKCYLGKNPNIFDPWKNGKTQDSFSIEKMLNQTNFKITTFDAHLLAKQLAKGEVLAFHEGKAAIGPRSLGDRSILANPAILGMRKKVSEQLKQREWFRPLAPIMRLETFKNIFPESPSSPYMLFNYYTEGKGFPEATHVDGTSRIQTIENESSNRLSLLLQEFESQTTIPALINTSLNAKNRAIAYTVKDVLDDFLHNNLIDTFVFGDKVITRI